MLYAPLQRAEGSNRECCDSGFFLSFFLSLVSSHLTGDSVQFSLAGRSDTSATSGVGFDDLQSLQLLQNASNDGTRRGYRRVFSHTSSHGAAQLSLQGTNAYDVTHVYLSCDGSSSDVVPVGVLGRKFLVNASLDQIGPARYLKLTRALQVSGELGDEFGGLYVSNVNRHRLTLYRQYTTHNKPKTIDCLFSILKKHPQLHPHRQITFLSHTTAFAHTSIRRDLVRIPKLTNIP